MVGVSPPALICRLPSRGSAVTVTAGQPALLTTRLAADVVLPTVPTTNHSCQPLPATIVFSRLKDVVVKPTFITPMPPLQAVAKWLLTVAFCTVNDPLREKAAPPESP